MQDEELCARPRLDIIQPLPESCEEISSDALTVRNFQDNECRDYRLGETIRSAPREMSRCLLLQPDFIMHRLSNVSCNVGVRRGINVFSSTEHSEGESLFYIISPKDIVVAKERDQDDHIDWLVQKKKYEVCVVEFHEGC